MREAKNVCSLSPSEKGKSVAYIYGSICQEYIQISAAAKGASIDTEIAVTYNFPIWGGQATLPHSSLLEPRNNTGQVKRLLCVCQGKTSR